MSPRSNFAAAFVFALILSAAGAAAQPGPVQHVIHISVDGLRPDAVTLQGPDDLPNFYRLRAEGAFTDNARTDADYSITLPNHMAQLTGRAVLGDGGHHWTDNTDPEPGETLHSRRGTYVTSVFDVVHDHGLRTGAYTSKSKFVLLDRSYDSEHGAPDVTGADDGRDKIDAFVYESDTDDLVERFVADLAEDPPAYAFLHLRDPDTSGHRWGWRLSGWHPYMRSVRKVDDLLGEVLATIDESPHLKGNTVVVLTADHGGSGHGHGDDEPEHYTVPFYVWGADVPAGDLYALNADLRRDPGVDQLGFDAPVQPIRNGGVANLAVGLLGLDPVPGSTINVARRMRIVPDGEEHAESLLGGAVAGPSSNH
jgi:predicted AlkP superfamily pyrophosphatase or phosphodiesterase